MRLLLPLMMILLVSCVPTKKYDVLNDAMQDLQSKYFDLKDEHELALQELEELRKKATELEELKAAYDQRVKDLQYTNEAMKHLQGRYDELLDSKEQIVTNANENINLLAEKERELAEQRNKLNELQGKLDAQADYLSNVKNNIRQALIGFNDDDLSLYEKEGKLYVSLSENLLFAKGSATLDKRGREAIGKIANALTGKNDLNLEVQGHTDPDGSEDLNWKLSTNRALSVVDALTEYGLPPFNMTASGRALYDPVAPNDTEENKSKNRRTEIILAPKLDEIFKYLEDR